MRGFLRFGIFLGKLKQSGGGKKIVYSVISLVLYALSCVLVGSASLMGDGTGEIIGLLLLILGVLCALVVTFYQLFIFGYAVKHACQKNDTGKNVAAALICVATTVAAIAVIIVFGVKII